MPDVGSDDLDPLWTAIGAPAGARAVFEDLKPTGVDRFSAKPARVDLLSFLAAPDRNRGGLSHSRCLLLAFGRLVLLFRLVFRLRRFVAHWDHQLVVEACRGDMLLQRPGGRRIFHLRPRRRAAGAGVLVARASLVVVPAVGAGRRQARVESIHVALRETWVQLDPDVPRRHDDPHRRRERSSLGPRLLVSLLEHASRSMIG